LNEGRPDIEDSRHRKLCVTHWGTGIGSNAWQEADVVFLFDEFFIPRRISIATAQGLLEHDAAHGPLRALRGYNSRNAEIDLLWEGHLLRWLKQMTLRGKARQFDENGVCSQQKLVTSADRRRLLSNFGRLFPGATIEVVPVRAASTRAKTKQSYADKLIDILGRPGLPPVISTSWISKEMGKPWRDVGRHIMAMDDVKKAIETLGWHYVLRKGKKGSFFQRSADRTAGTGVPREAGLVQAPAEPGVAFGRGRAARLPSAPPPCHAIRASSSMTFNVSASAP
jgi:hypothetical protein